MQNSSPENRILDNEGVDNPAQTLKGTRLNIEKKTLISLLKKHNTTDINFLDNPEIETEDVIVCLKRAKVNVDETFFAELARTLNLKYISKNEIKNQCHSIRHCRYATLLPYSFLKENLIFPMRISDNEAEIITANPLNNNAVNTVEMLLGERKTRWHVASIDSVDHLVERVYREIHKKQALLDLYYRNPEESAHQVLARSQKAMLITIPILAAAAFATEFQLTFIVLFSIINAVYFILNPIKFYISLKSLGWQSKVPNKSSSNRDDMNDGELPTYTVLVPVYHESQVLLQVMKNIYKTDYPKSKLEAKILIEEKDKETLQEAKRIGLFGRTPQRNEKETNESDIEFLEIFEPVIIPKADITTKPRACNYGLIRANGDYCVIYDAEDNPDPDQLRKAANTFSRSDDDIVCLQSRLNFYNANENLLTRFFSIEYTYWYNYYLEGLDQVNAPIPLGGTSNHFRTKQLRDLGSWDPYNVTEDADLGIRISRSNLKTEMMDSQTYEEAPVKVTSWIKQRSRWYKGHLQTYLVHMRHPTKLKEDMGWKRFLLFQTTFGAAIFMALINPILWLFTLITVIFPRTFDYLYFFPIQQICIFNLIVGNITFILMYFIACLKEKKYSYTLLSFLTPAYWILISIGAWRGLIQLITRPFQWEKTEHGVSKAFSG